MLRSHAEVSMRQRTSIILSDYLTHDCKRDDRINDVSIVKESASHIGVISQVIMDTDGIIYSFNSA